MQFDKLTVVKFLASGIVGIGAGKIVGNIIKNQVKPVTLIDKVTVTAAAWVIGAMASEMTKKYTNDTIENTVETIKSVTERVKENLTLSKVNRGEISFEESELDITKFQLKDGKWERIEEEKPANQ